MNVSIAPGLGLQPVETTNVVAMFCVGVTLRMLQLIARTQLPIDYVPACFGAGRIRFESTLMPRCTLSFTAKGCVLVTGASTVSAARLAAWAFCALLQRRGVPARVRNFTVCNMTSLMRLPYLVDLMRVYARFGLLSAFDPARFSAVRLHGAMPDARHITFTVFATGRVIISGPVSDAEVVHAARFIARALTESGAAAAPSEVAPQEYFRPALLLRSYGPAHRQAQLDDALRQMHAPDAAGGGSSQYASTVFRPGDVAARALGGSMDAAAAALAIEQQQVIHPQRSAGAALFGARDSERRADAVVPRLLMQQQQQKTAAGLSVVPPCALTLEMLDGDDDAFGGLESVPVAPPPPQQPRRMPKRALEDAGTPSGALELKAARYGVQQTVA